MQIERTAYHLQLKLEKKNQQTSNLNDENVGSELPGKRVLVLLLFIVLWATF